MPEERVIPTVETVAEFVITINGEALPPTVQMVAVNVMKSVNKVSSALIIFRDGEANNGEFPLSEGDLFLPGNTIEIAAGEPDNAVPVLSGVIIKQSVKIRNNRAAQLIVECRHKAVKTTIARKSNCFHDSTDADVITRVLQDAGFAGNEMDIESTTVTHHELVQYNCTDWDFILSRAEKNGKLVFTNDEKITVKAPVVESSASLSLLHGASIIELDAEMDCRSQYASVKSRSWDIAGQTIGEDEGADPGLEEQGNLAAADLASALGIEDYVLQHSGAITAAERKAWADARLLRSRLSKIRGRVKIQGIATVNPGDTIELNGIGERFNGNAFVSGVRHDYDMASGWKTQFQFGYTSEWFEENQSNDIVPAKAGGLLPGVVGLHTGIVTDNEDPEGEMRVRVKMPFISDEDDGVWARIAQADAGDQRGLFFRPEVGDEVVIGFLYDDPRQPVVLGMLNSSALPSPLSPSNDNHQKGYTSREKLLFLFDDDKKEIKIETPGGNKVTISDDQKGIVLEDQNGNKLEMNDQGIKIKSSKAVEIEATTDLKLTGLNLTLTGNASLGMSGSGSTKVESSGMLELKGSLVKIN